MISWGTPRDLIYSLGENASPNQWTTQLYRFCNSTTVNKISRCVILITYHLFIPCVYIINHENGPVLMHLLRHAFLSPFARLINGIHCHCSVTSCELTNIQKYGTDSVILIVGAGGKTDWNLSCVCLLVCWAVFQKIDIFWQQYLLRLPLEFSYQQPIAFSAASGECLYKIPATWCPQELYRLLIIWSRAGLN